MGIHKCFGSYGGFLYILYGGQGLINMDSKKVLSWLVVWLVGFFGTIKLGMGEVYTITSLIGLIFLNLGERKGVSAYSIFNENCKGLMGSTNPKSLITHDTSTVQEDLVDPEFFVKNPRLRNKPCPCGSGRKHKNCCLRSPEED